MTVSDGCLQGRRLATDLEAAPSQKSGAARTLERLRNEILPFFIALKYRPEKVEAFIEQVYRETKSDDAKVIMARVYELVTREEAAEKIPKDSNPPKQDTSYDSFAKKGLLDGEDW